MFPTSIEGQLDLGMLDSAAVDEVLTRIEQALVAARATTVARSGNTLTFRGGLFRFVSNWNVLGPVGYGEIEVVPGSRSIVRYNFSCIQLLVVATVMVSVMGIIARSLAVFVTSWIWLFGMNYLIGAVRLPRFVRRAAALE